MISYYFDESGKFKDHPVISFCGLAADGAGLQDFNDEWNRSLEEIGVNVLTMKKALNANRDLSSQRPARGVENRLLALTPFVDCVRMHLKFGVGVTIDVGAFLGLPEQTRRILNDNPFFTAFMRSLLETCEHIEEAAKVKIICDDEEEVAWEVYRLYRKIKLTVPGLRSRLVSLSFADDEVLPPLQAADLLSSLTRLEARRQLYGEAYDFEPLFQRICHLPSIFASAVKIH